jgi:hypothetical protein
MKRTGMIAALIALGALIQAGTVAAQTTLQSPQAIKTGLRIMNQVVGHTGRLIDAKSYDIVPHEQEEFDEGAKMLREAIAGEPEAFKSKVEPLIKDAVKASSAMGAAAKARDDAALGATHDQFATAVRSIIEQFPEDLRPKPGSMKGPDAAHGAGSPPPH